MSEEEEFYREHWVTKDGRIFKISELSDSHLLNILKMLERFHAITLARDFICLPEIFLPRGDAARDAFDDAVRIALEEGPESSYSGYIFLREEAIKRKLTTLEEREEYAANMETAAVLKLGGFDKEGK